MTCPIPARIFQPQVPVQGGGTFPVARILCIGRNYAAHAQEMGDHSRKPPFHFTKSPTALLTGTGELYMPYPPCTDDLHHEVELVVAIGNGGSRISASAASGHVCGYAVGLDMTRRDLQAEAKKTGRPWAAAKDFDAAAICGPLHAGAACPPPESQITLTVNAQPRQQGHIADMIWSVPELIAELSQLMRLHAGDLIYTGTPSGVGAVLPGDTLVATLSSIPPLVVHISPGTRPMLA